MEATLIVLVLREWPPDLMGDVLSRSDASLTIPSAILFREMAVTGLAGTSMPGILSWTAASCDRRCNCDSWLEFGSFPLPALIDPWLAEDVKTRSASSLLLEFGELLLECGRAAPLCPSMPSGAPRREDTA